MDRRREEIKKQKSGNTYRKERWTVALRKGERDGGKKGKK